MIVDDEPLAREGLRLRLSEEPDIEIVGEASDGAEAVEVIRTRAPELVFLDIQMPDCSGFDVVERVAADHLPVFVFVTAHDRYALRAFEAHALDYLLKPFTAARFQDALRRARTEIARGDAPEGRQRLVELLDARTGPAAEAAAPAPVVRFPVKDGERFLLLRAEDVDWVESAANYVRVHARGRSYLLRITMAEMERRLDGRTFTRIHRSTIVNVNRIVEIRPDWHGDFTVTLKTGATLRLSRAYRDALLL